MDSPRRTVLDAVQRVIATGLLTLSSCSLVRVHSRSRSAPYRGNQERPERLPGLRPISYLTTSRAGPVLSVLFHFTFSSLVLFFRNVYRTWPALTTTTNLLPLATLMLSQRLSSPTLFSTFRPSRTKLASVHPSLPTMTLPRSEVYPCLPPLALPPQKVSILTMIATTIFVPDQSRSTHRQRLIQCPI